MVHALREARRVLSPGGLLFDVRPAAVHRRVGLSHGGMYEPLAVMREKFHDDYAANRAVTQVINAGLFKSKRRIRFECVRMMDHLSEFQAWLEEFVTLGKMPSHDWLLQRVREGIKMRGGRPRIVVRGPVDLRLLVRLPQTPGL